MAIYKGFVIYLINSADESVIENLGTFVLSIPIASRSKSYGQINSYSDLQGFIDTPEKAGTAMFGIEGVTPSDTNKFDTLLRVAPLSVLRQTANTNAYIGNKLKIVNSSGYYAISKTIPAYTGVDIGWDLYDSNDVRLTSYLYLTSSYMYGDHIYMPVAQTITDNIITEMYGFIDYGVSLVGGSNYQAYAGITRSSVPENVVKWLNGLNQYIDNIDPYANGGDSGVSEPNGDFDDTSDPIDFPSLPSLGAVDSGFITLFNPDLTELQALARYMWTNPLFDISAWKKVFADPMDAILGLSIVPVAVPDSAARPIIVGNIVTDVSMKVATQQFVEVQCGSLNVNEFWSAYLDYAPYTKAEIYLPFCGVHEISIDDIMNKTVEVRYHIDILSGACCAFVKCGESVLYQFIGQCASSIPISGNDFTNVINGVLSAATAIGSLVATGGASAPLAVPSLSATALNALKPNIEKSGAMGGTGGMLAIQKPYLVLTRPRQAHPENQNHYTGYPSFITENLGDLSGYTEIEKIHLEGVPATDAELSEIETLLKGGVIL